VVVTPGSYGGEVVVADSLFLVDTAIARAAAFPRLRYMGSKYKLVPQLAALFRELGGRTALDAFSGSGVVSYTLKALNYAVTSNDFLAFPRAIAEATVVNQDERLTTGDVELITGPAADDRDFIQRTFDGLYFTADDRAFLDSAWSHIDVLRGFKRSLAIAALILAAARKQPRGVFTFTDLRYDDGRRDLHLPLRQHFVEAVEAYNAVVFEGATCRALQGDVLQLEGGAVDVVYLDPPYAPPKDDNCYIKRYHFLEGLAVYWEGLTILQNTKTKKLAKRYTPFSYKHTVTRALLEVFERFADSTIVLSYSSNAVPDAETIKMLMGSAKKDVRVISIDHRYHFGTHAQAQRRAVAEYLFVGQ
jgi:DNA adenine methylase/adenine-specific DNA-methyltransferase